LSRPLLVAFLLLNYTALSQSLKLLLAKRTHKLTPNITTTMISNKNTQHSLLFVYSTLTLNFYFESVDLKPRIDLILYMIFLTQTPFRFRRSEHNTPISPQKNCTRIVNLKNHDYFSPSSRIKISWRVNYSWLPFVSIWNKKSR